MSVNAGLLDGTPLDRVAQLQAAIGRAVEERLPMISEQIAVGEKLSQAEREDILRVAGEAIGVSGDSSDQERA